MPKEPIRQLDIERHFCAAMIELRKHKMQLSQEDLSQKLRARGWPVSTQATISDIETGKRRVNLTEAYWIAEMLETTINEMIEVGKFL